MRNLTPLGLVPVDGAVVPVLGSSLAFLCVSQSRLCKQEMANSFPHARHASNVTQGIYR